MNECGVLEGLHARAYDACIPLNVSLELTLRCNIRCTHCYNFDRDQPRAGTGAELSMDEIRPLLDDLRRSGTLFLSLTGGEAMVHPRFWDILDEAAARGFAVTVLSNGTLLTEPVCDRLAACPSLWGVSLSMYGARAASHDAITQVPGSYEKTMAGARRMAARGARVGLKFVLMNANAAEAGAMIDGAEAEGFEYSIDPTITGRYDGTSGSLATRVDPETLEQLYRDPLRSLIRPGPAEPTDDQFKCNCARGNAAVSSSGEVYPCIATPLRAGSIREQSFSRIWADSPVFRWIRGLRVADFKTCAPCGLKSWCRRSPGPAYLLTGDYTGVDPWTCREAEIIRSVAEPQTKTK
jgi:radical SAM protein with 4Fe4S-binding SPASM domain